MSEETQIETIAFLTRLSREASETQAPISTHISRVFFAGPRVFKLKRAVRTPYLDFSTPALRLAACEREVELNSRMAPFMYRGVRRIVRGPQGLCFASPDNADGEIVDAVVEMTRFAQELLFDRLAQAGALTVADMEALARVLASFHARAPQRLDMGGAATVGHVLAMNEQAFASGPLARDPALAPTLARMRAALAKRADLIEARRAAGKVRHCHGDLTLRNIAMIDGEPTPFDCLEFDEELATIDVLYDLAFPIMDLWHRGRAELANALLNRYLDAAQESDGLALMPLFVAMRAAIRAHVTASMARDAQGGAREDLEAEARAYLALAGEAMAPGRALLVGVGGLSGSGKSSVAAALAPLLAPLPGARVLSSDRIRKAMHGVAPTSRLPAEAYAPEVSARVYARAREEAAACLAAGWPAIADAVFDRAEDRARLADVARAQGASFAGFWLEADMSLLAARVRARKGDPSDADQNVLAAQHAKFEAAGETMDWTRLDAARAREETAALIRAAIDVLP